MAVDGIAKFMQLYIYDTKHELQPNDNQSNMGPSKQGFTKNTIDVWSMEYICKDTPSYWKTLTYLKANTTTNNTLYAPSNHKIQYCHEI
jgi:hypothetical protein